MASLGGFLTQKTFWSGQHALTVEVSSPFDDKVFQIYAGRRLVGVTKAVDRYIVIGQVNPTRCPAPVTIVMADLVDRDTDFGALLPRRPFNQYVIGWNASSFQADARWFSLHASPAPGEPVDYDVTVVRTPFSIDGAYSQQMPELEACGLQSYGVVSRDDAIPDGNPGTPAELAFQVVVYPPDVKINDDDKRLTVTVADGVATIDFEYDWPE